MYLMVPPALSRFILVESCEIAIIAFVQRLVLSGLEIPLTKFGEEPEPQQTAN